MKKKIYVLLIILSTIITSCKTNSKPENFDYGKVENHIYRNAFFNLKISLPPEWIVQTKEQTEELVKKGSDLVTGDNNNLKAIIKASEVNSAYLLTLFKHEVGAAVNYNPGLILIAENLKQFPGIKNGADYLFHTRKFLKQSQIQYNNIDDNFEKVKISNQEFYKMDLDLNHGNLNIKQSYYSTIKNGFSINFILSYINNEQKKELEEILNTLIFN